MITKLRTAQRRGWNCGECNIHIEIGQQYYDTNEGDGLGIFDTMKYCLECGKKEQKEKLNNP